MRKDMWTLLSCPIEPAVAVSPGLLRALAGAALNVRRVLGDGEGWMKPECPDGHAAFAAACGNVEFLQELLQPYIGEGDAHVS